MPSREYYIKSKDDDYKQAYLKYMVNIAVLLGANHSFAVSEMTDVLEFEMKLANVGVVRYDGFCLNWQLIHCFYLKSW